MSDAARDHLDREELDVEATCSTFTGGATDRDDLVAQLDALTPDERAEFIEGMHAQAGDLLPDDAGAWTWTELRDFVAAMWDECERRGET